MTKEIEYEEAPSGYVNFYNYKEPLMKFEDGYGFIGALVFDGETDKIQCHFCGEWFVALGNHLKKEHNMNASNYKDAVGLFQTTALIGEKFRAKLIANGLANRQKNLRPGTKQSKETREKIRNTLKKNGEKPESMNLRGTCPAQLIDRLKKLYEEQGPRFKLKEIPFRVTLKKTYGSIKNACEIAGVPYRESGQNLDYGHVIKYTEEKAIDFIKEFLVRFNKEPTRQDFIKQDQEGLYDSFIKRKKRLSDFTKQAYLNLDEYKKPSNRVSYSKEELLDFLRRFEKIHARKPSASDGKRCLIPYPSRYTYHFGSWKNALKLAFNK